MGIEKYFGLTGQCALVTGGAQSIGAAIAEALVDAGASVAIADIDIDGARATAEKLSTNGGTAVAIQADCSDENSIRQMVGTAASTLGKLNILVNNAGVYPYITLEDLSVAEFQRVYDLNVLGTFIAMREAIRFLRDSGDRGSIVNLSSMTAFTAGQPGLAAYGSSKAAVSQLTRNAALEFAEWNVTVNAIAPGFIHTAGTDHFVAGGMSDLLLQHQALKRVGTPEDIAALVVALCGPGCSFVTGTTLIADGGFLLI